MKIHDRHQFHGAALIQIAEHPAFTAINAFKHRGVNSTSAYTVNDNIGLYLKYAGKTHGAYREYKFTFSEHHLAELTALKAKQERTFAALVCLTHREICCLSFKQIKAMIDLRREYLPREEDSVTVYVQAPRNKKFRAYVSEPGRRGMMLGELLLSRNAFPGIVFPKGIRARHA